MFNIFDNSIEFVTIGPITMTKEAQLIIISGFILIFTLLIYYGLKPVFLLILLSYLLSAYKVNCMQVGNCNIFAKFIALATFFSVCYIIFFSLLK